MEMMKNQLKKRIDQRKNINSFDVRSFIFAHNEFHSINVSFSSQFFFIFRGRERKKFVNKINLKTFAHTSKKCGNLFSFRRIYWLNVFWIMSLKAAIIVIYLLFMSSHATLVNGFCFRFVFDGFYFKYFDYCCETMLRDFGQWSGVHLDSDKEKNVLKLKRLYWTELNCIAMEIATEKSNKYILFLITTSNRWLQRTGRHVRLLYFGHFVFIR